MQTLSISSIPSTQQVEKARGEAAHLQSVFFLCKLQETVQDRTVLWDNDALLQIESRNLLSRSAEIIRAQTQPALPKTWGASQVDRSIRLVLDVPGPRFVHVEQVESGLATRCTGNLCYTQKFAEATFRHALEAKASLRETISRAVSATSRSGSELSSLLPTWIVSWEKLVDDIFNSPQVVRMEHDQIHQCYVAGEFQTLNVDSTYRMMMALLGQSSYRSSKKTKASHRSS